MRGNTANPIFIQSVLTLEVSGLRKIMLWIRVRTRLLDSVCCCTAALHWQQHESESACTYGS